MENTPKDYAHIKGWGIDADPKNDPTYPMRKRSADDHEGYSWPRPPQQPIDREVLHSIERPNITAVFGTTAPPKGLSGMIRRLAFKQSENEYGHWLPLIMADRINVVEGFIDDLLHGKFPNTFAEKGGKARWKYDRKAVITNMIIGAALVGGAVALLVSRSRKDQDDDYEF